MMIAPAGFKLEPLSASGAIHMTEHLIVTGDDSGPHFNGFTSDSIMAVYALCRSEDVDSIVEIIHDRVDHEWITDRDYAREISTISNEVWHYDDSSRPIAPLLRALGFSPTAGHGVTPPPIDAIREQMHEISRTAIVGVFDPLKSELPIIGRLPSPIAMGRANSGPHSAAADTSANLVRGWRFPVGSLELDQRLSLQESFILLDSYLRKYGGLAQIGFLDDCRFWLGDMWAAIVVPSIAQDKLRKAGLSSLTEIAQTIRGANPRQAGQIRAQLVAGDNWIRHYVVRQLVNETMASLSAAAASAHGPPPATGPTSWFMDGSVFE